MNGIKARLNAVSDWLDEAQPDVVLCQELTALAQEHGVAFGALDLFQRHADGMVQQDVIGDIGLQNLNLVLRRVERYWTDQIRYIY